MSSNKKGKGSFITPIRRNNSESGENIQVISNVQDITENNMNTADVNSEDMLQEYSQTPTKNTWPSEKTRQISKGISPCSTKSSQSDNFSMDSCDDSSSHKIKRPALQKGDVTLKIPVSPWGSHVVKKSSQSQSDQEASEKSNASFEKSTTPRSSPGLGQRNVKAASPWGSHVVGLNNKGSREKENLFNGTTESIDERFDLPKQRREFKHSTALRESNLTNSIKSVDSRDQKNDQLKGYVDLEKPGSDTDINKEPTAEAELKESVKPSKKNQSSESDSEWQMSQNIQEKRKDEEFKNSQSQDDIEKADNALNSCDSPLSPESTHSQDSECVSEASVKQGGSLNGVRSQTPLKWALSQDLLKLGRPPRRATQRERLRWLQKHHNVGIWVQCTSCRKWRYLPDYLDVLEVPKNWYCRMNPDTRYDSCEKEISRNFSRIDLIDNVYSCGSLVWARVEGYPWWPAMVDDDPEFEEYYWLGEYSKTPTHYHVVFFDSNKVTRAWIDPKNLQPFKSTAKSVNKGFLRACDSSFYRLRMKAAISQAKSAASLGIPERLEIYSFIARYKGPVFSFKHGIHKFVKKYNLPEFIDDSDQSSDEDCAEEKRELSQTSDDSGSRKKLKL